MQKGCAVGSVRVPRVSWAREAPELPGVRMTSGYSRFPLTPLVLDETCNGDTAEGSSILSSFVLIVLVLSDDGTLVWHARGTEACDQDFAVTFRRYSPVSYFVEIHV